MTWRDRLDIVASYAFMGLFRVGACAFRALSYCFLAIEFVIDRVDRIINRFGW